MRRWLAALAVFGAVAPAWGQGEPEVYFLSPQAGAAIEGTPWVTVTGRARGPRVEPTAGGFTLTLEEPVVGVAAGQAAVLYEDDAVVGSGLVAAAS